MIPLFLCCLLVFYIYGGYPLLLWLLARHGRPVRKGEVPGPCAVVIAAHNEQARIGRKLRQLLDGDNGALVHRVVVVSDGSTDGTDAAVAGVADERVRLVRMAERSGKSACLNRAIGEVDEDFVVLMDARQDVGDGVIRALLENFADEEAGVVSGELVFRSGAAGRTAEGVGAYWRYEKWIRKMEARWWAVPGATGACYAIRRPLWKPIPAETLLDDVAIPMLAILAGKRCLFEERAVVVDNPSGTSREESVRKRRTVAGNVQLPRLFPVLLSPRQNPIWFQYISHKILRLFSPFLLIGAALSALRVAVYSFPGILCAVLGAALLMLAAAAPALQKSRLFRLFFSVPRMFLILNVVTFLGVLDALRGRFTTTWQRAYNTAVHHKNECAP
jgi:poly-beta-1,6-N-acetyl-D-glucosamine synthase